MLAANPDLQAEFRRVLPDYRPEDNLGSAYCVRDYVVAAHLGGPDALAQAHRVAFSCSSDYARIAIPRAACAECSCARSGPFVRTEHMLNAGAET